MAPLTRYAMALDTLTCIGCYACTLACKVENGSPSGIWTAPVIQKEIGTFPDVRRAFIPLLCNHCADAPCLKACPTRAIARRDDGIVLIDQDICCGSQACVIACPYGAIHYYERADQISTPFDRAKVSHHQPGTAQKCNLCVDRLDRGLKPACVEACPTGARIFGDLEDPHSPVAEALRSRDSVALGSPVDTAPAMRYLTEGMHRAGGTDADIALSYRPQKQWGFALAVEFWLLGGGAGLFAASRWLAPDLSLFGLELGSLGAFVLVAVGGLILIGHLGRPFRFLNAMTHWRASWISRGAIANLLFLAVVGLLALPVATAVGPVGTFIALVLAAVVATYPGLAMGAMQSVPAWRGRRIALEYLVESLMLGVALIGLLDGWGGEVLGSLLALALLRAALALWSWRLVPALAKVAILGAGLAAGLAFLALLGPSAAALLGTGAAVAALVTGLVTKVINLNLGASPSPFSATGELGGSLDAER